MMQLSANSHGFHRQMLAKRFKILDRWQITQRNRDLHCLLNSDCITEVKPISCLTMLTWEKWAFHDLRIPKYIFLQSLRFFHFSLLKKQWERISNRENFEQCFCNRFAINQKHFFMHTFLFQFTSHRNAWIFFLNKLAKNTSKLYKIHLYALWKNKPRM